MVISVSLGTQSYPIILDSGVLSHAGEHLTLARRVLVVTDSGVPEEYAETVAGACRQARICTVPAGESSKNMGSYQQLLGEMLALGMGRGDCVVAVGGGMVGDLAGFAAATYMRGVDFYNVPTTLLAQVDASIGGKNGVNFHAYKNMVGTITQPEWIYICTDALRTLSPREFRAGIAEVLKTFILFDAEYYRKAVDYFARMEAHLRKAGTCCGGECVYGQEELTEIIRKTALYKCAVVERDAFEKGERRLLNLGHTFAHAIEKNCPIMHGEAVAIGLVLAAGVSERLGLAPAGLAVGLAEDLKKVGLPTQSPIAIGVLLEALEKDKKVEGDAIHFILPRAVGEVVDRAIPLKQLEEVARDLR